MIYKISLLVFFILFPASVYPQNFAQKKENLIIAQPQKLLKVGEKLKYSLELLGVPFGQVILNIEELKIIGANQECYHIIANITTNKIFAKIYDIEYILHTYLDKETFAPIRFEKNRRLKDKFNYTVIDFDWQTNEAKYKFKGDTGMVEISPLRGEVVTKNIETLKISPGTQDLLSSLYYLRFMDIKENVSPAINIYYGRRNWGFKLKIERPFIKDFRNFGSLAVFKVDAFSELNDFIFGKGNFSIFFTTDSRRIPVEFKLGTGIGAIKGKIKSSTY